MELKKNPRIDLSKKRPMFLSIGLMISLIFVTSAFQWSTAVEPIPYYDDFDFPEESIIDIINTSQPPPKRPKVMIQPIFKAVVDDIAVPEVDVIIDPEDVAIIDIPIDLSEYKEESIVEAPLIWTDRMPEPQNGLIAFQKFLAKNIKYPNQARRMGIEGKVFIQFVVDKEGNVSEIKTLKGIGAGCDEEAERVMALLPKWKPGRQGAKRVAVRMIMPISFRLN